MTLHTHQHKTLKSLNEEISNTSSESESFTQQKRNDLLEICLHLSDISNPAKPFHLAKTWAERISEEFHRQVFCILRV